MKTCRDCKQEKPRSEFYANSNARPGLQPYCKSCHKARAARSRKRRLEAPSRSPVEEKRCPGCREVKHWTEFSRNRAETTGLQARCKACTEADRRSRVYGLRPEAYRQLVEAQKGRCAACGEESRLVVDHCHATGAVRALLCSNCNTAEGLLRTPARARALADYIEAFEGRSR